MSQILWERFPCLSQSSQAKSWLTIQSNIGLAANTIEAYGRALEDYFSFSANLTVSVDTANREHIAAYVRDLSIRPNLRSLKIAPSLANNQPGLANATIQQRLTVLRLYYDYLIEEGIRTNNPVGRGRYTPGKGFGGTRQRGLLQHYHTLPWIPNDVEWQAILEAAKQETFRNRVMLALAYDAGLRREELCTLSTSDLDPALCTIHIRAENTKNRRARVIPYSQATARLYAAYLKQRRELSTERGLLFLSESRRNWTQPISIWAWSKVVQRLAEHSGVTRLTTHTFRHLCLTDLARAGWEMHEIATFAGHRNLQSTLLYIHLSGRDLAARLQQGMTQIHNWRINMLAEVLE